MPHNARVLSLNTAEEIAAEMRKVGSDEPGIRHMVRKAKHYLVKLERVRRPVAHIIKEAFLSQGGDAAVHGAMITATEDYSDVIMSGTIKQYDGVVRNLREQGFGCDKIATEILQAIQYFESEPARPAAESVTDLRLTSFFESLGQRTLIMGILNVTPDSFSDGGLYSDRAAAISRGIEMAEQGADIIDVGGESTRPGSDPVSQEEEIARVVPVVEELSSKVTIPLSVDTTKATVARLALEAGASIVNDVSSATADPAMPGLLAERGCPAVLMHMKGTPKDMQVNPQYDDLMGEICRFLRERIAALVAAGVSEGSIIVDPGFGFGKTVEHNLTILRRLRELKSLGRPILLGTSRKSTIGKVLGDLPAECRMEGTAATVALAIANGADIVRVHDVQEMSRVARMADAVIRPRHGSDRA